MTGPLNREGDVTVGVNFVANDASDQLQDVAEDAARGAEPDFRHTGEQMGEALGQGVTTGIRRERRQVRRAVEDLIPLSGKFKIKAFFDPSTGEVVRRSIFQELEDVADDAFKQVTRPGGPFQQVGRGIADAIGAGFNVSGRSPLIGVLIFAFGAIADAIVALLVAGQALGAFLLSLPALILSVVVQVGVLVAAFNKVGPAIGQAFAAKNAQELNKALQDLTPSGAAFVRALLPLKPLLSDLQRISESRFFQALGTNISGLIFALGPILRGDLGEVAQSLGVFFHDLVDLLKSPVFTEFLTGVLQATVEWINRFGPAFIMFLDGLFRVGTKLLPYLIQFGSIFAGEFEIFGNFLKRLASDPKFNKFLETAYEITLALFRLLNVFLEFIATFISSLVAAGGQETIDALIEGLVMLTQFFSSPAGLAALAGFIKLIVFMTKVFFGLILAASIFLGLVGSVIAFFDWFLFTAIPWLYGKWEDLVGWVIQRSIEFAEWIRGLPGRIANWLAGKAGEIKSAIVGWFNGAGDWLINAGKNLVKGFIRGILGLESTSAMANAASQMAKIAQNHLSTGSPAKEGPMSGSSYPTVWGEDIVKGVAEGMTAETKSLSKVVNQTVGAINFGANAIRIEYNGVNPTPEQARITGSAVGDGLAAQMLARRTVASIRTL